MTNEQIEIETKRAKYKFERIWKDYDPTLITGFARKCQEEGMFISGWLAAKQDAAEQRSESL